MNGIFLIMMIGGFIFCCVSLIWALLGDPGDPYDWINDVWPFGGPREAMRDLEKWQSDINEWLEAGTIDRESYDSQLREIIRLRIHYSGFLD